MERHHRHMRRWEDTIKVGLKEIVLEIVYRIHVIQDNVKRCVSVNKFFCFMKGTQSLDQ